MIPVEWLMSSQSCQSSSVTVEAVPQCTSQTGKRGGDVMADATKKSNNFLSVQDHFFPLMNWSNKNTVSLSRSCPVIVTTSTFIILFLRKSQYSISEHMIENCNWELNLLFWHRLGEQWFLSLQFERDRSGKKEKRCSSPDFLPIYWSDSLPY